MTKRTSRRRKANTAMVFNPSRGLSIGGRSSVRRTARKNPGKRTAAVAKRTNPARRIKRRSNPATVTGLVITAVMAGIGVTIFDVVTARVIPQTSPLVRVMLKLGGAWVFQSQLGSKVPVLGKYKNDIALVLLVSGVIDIGKLYVLPALQPFLPAGLLGTAQPALQEVGDGNVGNIYGNPSYIDTAYA